jgi:Mor family transcriptional regulator
MNKQELRQLAIALMDDQHGINQKAHQLLSDALSNAGGMDDILIAVKQADSYAGRRFYLPEDFGK